MFTLLTSKGKLRILVEAHSVPEIETFMQGIAKSAEFHGHKVVWWNEPQYPPPKGDIAFIWNPLAGNRSKFVDYWALCGIPSMAVELGWYPQRKTYQVDHLGINVRASWYGKPIQFRPKNRIVVERKDKILVLLQTENDTQLQFFSPWLSLNGMLQHLIEAAPQALVVRKHPRNPPSPETSRIVEASNKCSWDDSATLADALEKYDIVATLNSSGAVEAMAKGKMILCFAMALYRTFGAVICATPELSNTKKVLERLDEVEIWKEAQQAVLENLLGHQWALDTMNKKLKKLLDDIPRVRCASLMIGQ